jgi:hypothetical protein
VPQCPGGRDQVLPVRWLAPMVGYGGSWVTTV